MDRNLKIKMWQGLKWSKSKNGNYYLTIEGYKLLVGKTPTGDWRWAITENNKNAWKGGSAPGLTRHAAEDAVFNELADLLGLN